MKSNAGKFLKELVQKNKVNGMTAKNIMQYYPKEFAEYDTPQNNSALFKLRSAKWEHLKNVSSTFDNLAFDGKFCFVLFWFWFFNCKITF